MTAQLTLFGTWDAIPTKPLVAEQTPMARSEERPEQRPTVPDPRQCSLFDGPQSIRHEAHQCCLQLDAVGLRQSWRTATELYPSWPGSQSWLAWSNGIEQLLGNPTEGSAQEQAVRALSLWEGTSVLRFPEMSTALLGQLGAAALCRAASRLLAEEGMISQLPDGRPAGYLFLLARRSEEAVAALQSQANAWTDKKGRGLLLGYLGESLYRCHRSQEALVAYRDAYCEDPLSVDETELTCRPIMDLLDTCAELDLPDDSRGWLPALADLLGVIPLAGCRIPSTDGASAAQTCLVLLAAYRRKQSEGMDDAERIRRKREILKLAPGLKEPLRRV